MPRSVFRHSMDIAESVAQHHASNSLPPQRPAAAAVAQRTIWICMCVTLQVLPLSEARSAAAGHGLDLVEVNARTDPPVAR